MRSRSAVALAALSLASAAVSWAAEPSPHFKPLLPMLNKTWRGEMPAAAGKKPAVDVQRWELALNGKAVRILHSIDDGAYGGESLVVWDEAKQSLVFYYFTTAGFYTTGTATVEDGTLVTVEAVKGSANGVAEVKGATRLLPDGRLHVKTKYFKDGAWTEGRDIHYVEAPGAEVRFK
jgi:hypothetical protein